MLNQSNSVKETHTHTHTIYLHNFSNVGKATVNENKIGIVYK